MGFIRRALYLISIAGIVYGGIQINITEQTLVSSLVPFLLLWIMVDVPHYLTLGLLDLSNALFVIFKRTSISLPDNYRGFVLPIDVDDSGMMKQDKYVRAASYGIRKLWLKTGLEKEFVSSGFSMDAVSRSLVVKDALGLYDRYRIRSQIVSIRDEFNSFFVEQKFVSGPESHIHAISYVQFKIIDNNAHLRKPGAAAAITVSKVFSHALTRRMAPPKRTKLKGGGSKVVAAKSEEADKVIAEIASMCMDDSVKPELFKFICHSCGVDELKFAIPKPKVTEDTDNTTASPRSTSTSTSTADSSTSTDASEALEGFIRQVTRNATEGKKDK